MSAKQSLLMIALILWGACGGQEPPAVIARVERLEHARVVGPPAGSWRVPFGAWAGEVRAGNRSGADAAVKAMLATPGFRKERIFLLPAGLDPVSLLPEVQKTTQSPADWDLLLATMADAVPFQKGATRYGVIADALDKAQQRALADRWRARMQVVEQSFINDPVRVRTALDRLARVTSGIFWALALMGLAIGVGLGARKQGPQGPAVLHFVGLLTLGFCALLATGALAGQVETLEKHATVPAALLMDEWSRPEVKDWVEKKVREPARSPLLRYAEAEAKAAPGTHSKELPPADATMRQALSPSQGFFDRLPAAARNVRLSELLPADSRLPTAPVDSLARALLALLAALVLGALLGRAVPQLSRILQLVVPGASRWLAPFGGLTCAAVLAGLFNLGAGAWAVAALIGGLVVHALGVLADRKLGPR